MAPVVVFLLICAAESLTKGFLSILLVPVSLLILPLTFFLQQRTLSVAKSSNNVKLRRMSDMQILCLALAYFMAVGVVGLDEQTYILFGFWHVDATSIIFNSPTDAFNFGSLVNALNWLAAAFGIMAITLAARMYISLPKASKAGQKRT